MFLRASQWANMQNDAAYTPGIHDIPSSIPIHLSSTVTSQLLYLLFVDEGSLVNFTRSARTFLAETTITSSQDEYYIVVCHH
jgi:hypothetical protein